MKREQDLLCAKSRNRICGGQSAHWNKVKDYEKPSKIERQEKLPRLEVHGNRAASDLKPSVGGAARVEEDSRGEGRLKHNGEEREEFDDPREHGQCQA